MDRTKLPLEVNGKDLRLGDTVELFSAYGSAIVYKLTPDTVSLRRPYMVTTDFSMGGEANGTEQVITYIGMEDFSCARNAPFKIVKRGEGIK